MTMKVIGKRKAPDGSSFIKHWDGFVELASTLKHDKLFVPRGIYRFKTFEDANKWRDKMLLGQKPDK